MEASHMMRVFAVGLSLLYPSILEDKTYLSYAVYVIGTHCTSPDTPFALVFHDLSHSKHSYTLANFILH